MNTTERKNHKFEKKIGPYYSAKFTRSVISKPAHSHFAPALKTVLAFGSAHTALAISGEDNDDDEDDDVSLPDVARGCSVISRRSSQAMVQSALKALQ